MLPNLAVGVSGGSFASFKPVAVSTPPKKTWTVGTLTYTRRGLAALFAWMLWGDFAWAMRDRSILPVVQLAFKKYGASDVLVALLFNSIPMTIGLLTGPFIAYLSDRHRGRWGRRMPFLFFSTPFIVLSIVALAFSPQMGAGMRQAFFPSMELNRAVLICSGVFLVIFECFCGLAYGMFGGLVNDVVPQPLIGRFFGLFRMVSLFAGIIFSYWFFGKAEAHYVGIFLGVALLYGIGFTMLCVKVREGEYPPPHRQSQQGEGWLKRFLFAAGSYLKDGYGNRYYLWFFAAMILAPLLLVPGNLYGMYFAKSIGMNMDAYGKYMSYSFVVSLCLAYPLGALADRFHPLRMTIVMIALNMLLMLGNALYMTDPRIYGFSLMAQSVFAGAYYTVSLSLPQKLLPWNKFARIGSAGGIIGTLIGIVFAPALGMFLDHKNHDYRYIFYIAFFIALAALAVNMVLYRKFLALGGPKNYVAPE